MEQVTEKRCSKCGEVKVLTEFHKRKDRVCSYRSECKTCLNLRSAKWKSENRELVSIYNKQYRSDNPEMVKIHKSLWATRHPEKVRLRRNKTGKSEHDRLSDSYVAGAMRLTVKTCPPELIKLKRIQIKITRELRSKK